MMGVGKGPIVRDLDQLFRRGVGDASDGELIARFLATGDGGAFEAIVARHGPMVRGVCGRLLRDPHDADDAFQATFLVLARSGSRLRNPDRLASWLYGIARRVCLKARARSDRRRTVPLRDDVPAGRDGRTEWADVLELVDSEVARLPAPQRDVLVLCLLGGATEREASRRLDCPVGTIKSRLARGKEALRGRLIRRGVAPATALAATSAAEAFASPASSHLIRATLAMIAGPAAVAPAIATLARGVVTPMIANPLILKLCLAAMLGAVGLIATGWTADPPPPENPPTSPLGSERADVKVENLRRILLALHQYREKYGHFPFPASYGRDQKPKLSWRVALLPFLGEEALYKEFHLDEPWDGEHNKALIPRMPEVYRTPDIPTEAGKTRYRGFIHTETAWIGPQKSFTEGAEMSHLLRSLEAQSPPDLTGLRELPMIGDKGKNSGQAVFQAPRIPWPPRGATLEEIRDGLSNTAMLGVASEAMEWTHVREIRPRGEIATTLDKSDPRGLVVGMADGSVRFLPDSPNRETFLEALLTRAGGEVLDWTSYFAREVPDTLRPVPPLRHAATAPEPAKVEAEVEVEVENLSLEERMRRMEEKLDRLLRRLDPAGGDGR